MNLIHYVALVTYPFKAFKRLTFIYYTNFHLSLVLERSFLLTFLPLRLHVVASRKKEEGFAGFREEHDHVGGRHEVSRCCEKTSLTRFRNDI